MFYESRARRFERVVMPHVAAAYNLARWLLGNVQDAEDVMQEASLRAFRHLDRLQGDECRAWFFTIVRHECYDWNRKKRPGISVLSLDDDTPEVPSEDHNPERIALQKVDEETLRAGVESLPIEFREVFILRELEELPYKDIAKITDTPIGTVMSRLARGRKRLQTWLVERQGREC